MKEAMDYGQQLKEDNTRPQVMSVNERKGWFTKIRKQFRK